MTTRVVSPRLLAPLTVGLLIIAVAACSLLALKPSARIVYDEQSHHLPAIRAFSEQLPTPDLRDYPVATTPGYHLLMAAAQRYLGFGDGGLRAINILLSAGLVAAVGWAIAKRNSTSVSVLLTLPLLFSVYVVTSAAWLLPENAGWALVAVILVLSMRETSPRTLVWMSLALVALVLVRQSHVWCAALVVAAVLWNDQRTLALRRAPAGLLAVVPALGVLGAFVILWHGLVPPMFQAGGREYELSTQYSGWAALAPGFTLALVGFYGMFLLPWFCTDARLAHNRRQLICILALGAAIGLILGMLPESTFHIPNRRSGLWRLVQMAPYVADRSPVIWVLSSIGGAISALALLVLERRDRWIMLIGLLAFMLAQCANPMVWQRYYEPWVLMWLLLAASRVTRDTTTPLANTLRMGGLTILILFQIAVTLYTLRGSGE